jgi:hypothetical protein
VYHTLLDRRHKPLQPSWAPLTYTLVLVGPVADRYASGIAAENERAALEIADVAGRLVPLE